MRNNSIEFNQSQIVKLSNKKTLNIYESRSKKIQYKEGSQNYDSRER